MKATLVLAIPALMFAVDVSAGPNARNGQNVFTCEVKNLDLGEGHSLLTWHGKGLQVTTPGSPDHLSDIECLGSVETMPDKSFKANGYCLHVDRDGDKWIDRWWNDSTMKTGRWEQTGLSGKYKGPRPTGTFVYTDRSSDKACKGVSNWQMDG